MSHRSRHRHSKRRHSAKGRHKGSRRAKRSQNRRGIRASSRGFRKMKRRGRTSVTKRTFTRLRRHARNPAGVYHRSLRDGSKVTVHDDGRVIVQDENGRTYSSYRIGTYEVPRFLKSLGTGRYANKGHYRGEDMSEEYHELAMNPRRGRGRHRAKRGRHHSRRNPMQFPVPFVSALNPGRRRGRKSRRNCGMPSRRNHPISRRDAKSMKRVLRQHRYKCR